MSGCECECECECVHEDVAFFNIYWANARVHDACMIMPFEYPCVYESYGGFVKLLRKGAIMGLVDGNGSGKHQRGG